MQRLALSLDGPTAALHDAFRGQPGSFAYTVAGLQHARACGVPVQINTTVTRRNLDALPAIAERVAELGASVWSAFFLVTVGRAASADQLTAQECEDVFGFLYELGELAPYRPHHRRAALPPICAAAAGSLAPPWAGRHRRARGRDARRRTRGARRERRQGALDRTLGTRIRGHPCNPWSKAPGS